ncbi:SDR family oxidoreductase [Paraburkholderia sp.]|uniref:SDR family oxidoreductase n=1 Tax=Paraburkholderia sp. TaxID=1926495 RepID=UPI002579AEE7|nr:SDR family oxidoreductase [Paraburkholderia sp.]
MTSRTIRFRSSFWTRASKRIRSRSAEGRVTAIEEIAELMAFIVSPAARWMTGSALRMDGGEVKSI